MLRYAFALSSNYLCRVNSDAQSPSQISPSKPWPWSHRSLCPAASVTHRAQRPQLCSSISLGSGENPVRNSRLCVEILALSETWVAVNKPAGMLVHRTKLYHSVPGEIYLLDEVRRAVEEQRGIPTTVLPVQRLDRPTSGVVLFALGSSQNASALQAALQSDRCCKQYWVLSFGADMPKKWENNHPLRDMTGKVRKQRGALSSFEQLLRLDQADMSVVRAQISTGRRHQIRRHLSNSRYPVVGDTSHGKGSLNKEAREKYGVNRCCLHSRRVSFTDTIADATVTVEASVPNDLRQVLNRLSDYAPSKHQLLVDLGDPLECSVK